ncbi:MAG: Sec-independent protein translocase protein TatB [Rhodospirillales bacterium]|nr:Sec-independent protein translocase protein TatB [Rhodospirillales bacterium]
MFDIGWQELFIISVLAIIVIGPKDLPQALRTVTAVVRKMRGLAREFQSGVDDLVREAELDGIKSEIDKVRRFDFEQEVKKEVDPTGILTEDFDPADFAREIKQRVDGDPPSKSQSAASDPEQISKPEPVPEQDPEPTADPQSQNERKH